MKTLLTETRIRRAPLQQLLFHREFNRRLHRLGMSARERRESAFDVKLDPSSVRHFLLSPVINGGTTHVMPSRDLSDLFDHSVDGSAQKIMHIHNHPVYNHPKYGSWNDFFSDVDLQSPFTEGSVAGLVFVPHRKDSLILLLGQQKTFSATSLAAGRNLYGEVRMNFWHKYKKGLKDFHNELGFASGALQFLREALDISERAWMRAAVESLTELGMTAVAQIYYFPQDCTEEFFLGLNSRGKLKDNWRYGGFDGFETNRKRLFAWS
ncbi:MAG: hypothetical protein KKA31_06005, partial [Candidatus Margulisbacteria bacterium]|nr:hypothetical protein [Candidatus Margulisiibacteriota bacterium]